MPGQCGRGVAGVWQRAKGFVLWQVCGTVPKIWRCARRYGVVVRQVRGSVAVAWQCGTAAPNYAKKCMKTVTEMRSDPQASRFNK